MMQILMLTTLARQCSMKLNYRNLKPFLQISMTL